MRGPPIVAINLEFSLRSTQSFILRSRCRTLVGVHGKDEKGEILKRKQESEEEKKEKEEERKSRMERKR